MMSFKKYLVSKVIYVVLYAFTLAIILLFFLFFNIPLIYFFGYLLGSLITFIFFFIINYIILYRNFNNMLKSLKDLENPQFILYMYSRPQDFESQIIYNIIKKTNDNLYYKYKSKVDLQNDYQDYINMWIHEVKLPIQNIKNSTIKYNDERLNNEIDALTFLVDNSLTLAKINFDDFTFLITKINMKRTINTVIKENFNKINYANCKIEINIEDFNIYIDEYWIKFIINQLIDNSIKYRAKEIKITAKIVDDKCIISVCDNGLGIYEDEIPYVFNKFYIGSHTKKYVSSSGFGLYMVKQVVDKLDIAIHIKSKVDVFTEVILEIPLNYKKENIEDIVEIINPNK